MFAALFVLLLVLLHLLAFLFLPVLPLLLPLSVRDVLFLLVDVPARQVFTPLETMPLCSAAGLYRSIRTLPIFLEPAQTRNFYVYSSKLKRKDKAILLKSIINTGLG